MKNRGAIGLGVVVAVLGLYLAYDLRSEKGEKAKTDQAAALFPFTPEQVNEFTLEKGTSLIHVVRAVDGWRIDEPLKDWADNAFADDFVDRVVKDKSLEFASEGPNVDWKVYGLDKPAGRVTLKTQSGESRTIAISEKHNFEGNALAHIEGEEKVRVVPASWNLTIDRKPLEFRDKRLFRGKIGAVEQFDIHNAFGDITLIRKEGLWTLPAHPEWELAQNKVREWLSDVNETKATDFTIEHAPSAAEKAKLGWKKAEFTIRFGLPDKKDWTAGVQKLKGKPFAEVSEPAAILALEMSALDKIRAAKASDLRNLREPFNFKTTEAHELRVKTPLKETILKETKASWELLEGSDSSKKIETARVGELLTKIHELPALEFATAGKAASFKGSSILEIRNEKNEIIFSVAWDPAFHETRDGMERDLHLVRTNKAKDLLIVEAGALHAISFADLTAKPVSTSPEAE